MLEEVEKPYFVKCNDFCGWFDVCEHKYFAPVKCPECGASVTGEYCAE